MRRAAPFAAPALVLLAALVAYPALATIAASFRDRTGDAWVGLANYRELVQTPRVVTALRNNAIWVLIVPSVVTALGLVFAVTTERISFGTAVRTVVFMPMAISFLAAGVIWRLVYEEDPRRGMLNAAVAALRPAGPYAGASPSTGVSERRVRPGDTIAFGMVGVRAPKDGLEAVAPAVRPGRVSGVVFRDFSPAGPGTAGVVDPGELGLPGVRVVAGEHDAITDARGRFTIEIDGESTVRLDPSAFRRSPRTVRWLGPALVTPAVMAAYVWMWAGFATVVIAAGLASIPRELLEAARVDGATEWQVFRRVTVPLLAPVLGVVLVTMTINALKVFDIVLVVAPEGVQRSANVIALEMWRTAFGARDQGLGSAAAVVLFLLVLPVTAINLRRLRSQG